MTKRALILLATVLLLAVAAVVCIHALGEDGASAMFCNDSPWEEETRLGFERIFSQYYLPVSMFAAIDGVDVKENTRLNTLLISYGNRYISFDIDSNFAYTEEDGSFFLRTYLLKGGERYVQAESVCKALGLSFETNEEKGVVRIRDNTATKTLDQLIASAQQSETTSPPQTTPPVATDPVRPTAVKSVYLFFDGLPADPTAVLKLLETYNAGATFFVSAQDLTGNLTLLTDLLAGGHAVGLSTVDGIPESDAAILTESLHSQNETLFRIGKLKTRLFHMPYGANGHIGVSADVEKALIAEGFLLCHSTIDVWDEYDHYTAAQITTRVLSELLENETPILRFGNGTNTVSILEGILRYLSQNASAYDIRVMDYSSYAPY